MKPIRILTSLALGAALLSASAMPAEARSNLNIGVGIDAGPSYYAPAPVYYAPPPVYYAPAPVYYETGPSVYYSNGWERHRHYNWGYWHQPGHHYGHRY